MALTDYEDTSLDTTNDLVAAENRARFERSLQANPWGLSPKALEAKAAARAMISTKTGLHARIPITCIKVKLALTQNLAPFYLMIWLPQENIVL